MVGQRVWKQRLLEQEQELEDRERELKKQERALAERVRCLQAREYKIEERESMLAYLQKSAASPEEETLKDSVDRKKLESCIETLCRVRKIEWEPMKETEEGAWQVGYPRYPDEIFRVFELMELDSRYSRHMDVIREQGIRLTEMSLSQIQTYLTYLHRGERFCEGTIAEAVDDGRLLKLLLRLQDLIDPYPWYK